MFPKTIILRHRRENLKKCSLRGLEIREDMAFYSYPIDQLPSLQGYCLLTLGAPPLSPSDHNLGLFLIDGTWRYAEKMFRQLPLPHAFVCRSLPPDARTAYPRRQEDCEDPTLGLASVEALYLAYQILGRPVDGLLDHYHWKSLFLIRRSSQVTEH